MSQNQTSPTLLPSGPASPDRAHKATPGCIIRFHCRRDVAYAVCDFSGVDAALRWLRGRSEADGFSIEKPAGRTPDRIRGLAPGCDAVGASDHIRFEAVLATLRWFWATSPGSDYDPADHGWCQQPAHEDGPAQVDAPVVNNNPAARDASARIASAAAARLDLSSAHLT